MSRCAISYLTLRFIFGMILLVIACGVSHAAIDISPAYVQVALDRGRPSGEFVLSNTGDTEERYRIRSASYKFSETGELQRLPSDENSLASWIIFNPKELTIAPKTKRIVRFVIATHGNVRPGEYWAAMELESLNVRTTILKPKSETSLNLQISSSILVPIYAQSGKITCSGGPSNAKVFPSSKGPVIQCTFTNSGNGRIQVSGEYDILDAGGKIVLTGPFCHASALPGSTRLLTRLAADPLPDGKYKVKIRFNTPQLGQTPVQEADFEWKAPAPSN